YRLIATTLKSAKRESVFTSLNPLGQSHRGFLLADRVALRRGVPHERFLSGFRRNTRLRRRSGPDFRLGRSQVTRRFSRRSCRSRFPSQPSALPPSWIGRGGIPRVQIQGG